MSIIAFDSHKQYTFARAEDKNGRNVKESRIEHRRGNIVHFLRQHQVGSPVAVETIGNWYWIIDEIEKAGMQPLLAHARKAKLMLGCINKTDKLDAEGLNKLQRAGTLPGVGFILAVVILHEIGDIVRFGSAERLASYCGVTPRVHSSGGKTRYGRLRPDTNHYLKWAFSEAGNSVAVNHKRYPQRHVSRLYKRIRHRTNHAKAIGAVGRHLAEATYWMLTKGEPYRERGSLKVSSTGA